MWDKVLYCTIILFEYFIFGCLLWLMMPYGAKTWVNIGSGKGLLVDSTKPLPETILTRMKLLITQIWLEHCLLALLQLNLHSGDLASMD